MAAFIAKTKLTKKPLAKINNGTKLIKYKDLPLVFGSSCKNNKLKIVVRDMAKHPSISCDQLWYCG